MTTLMFAELEAKIKEVLANIDGEVKKEALAALAKAKQDEVSIAAVINALKAEVVAAAVAAEPAVKAAIEAAVAKAEAALEQILAGAV